MVWCVEATFMFLLKYMRILASGNDKVAYIEQNLIKIMSSRKIFFRNVSGGAEKQSKAGIIGVKSTLN